MKSEEDFVKFLESYDGKTGYEGLTMRQIKQKIRGEKE